jgi:hypothetical protein
MLWERQAVGPGVVPNVDTEAFGEKVVDWHVTQMRSAMAVAALR